MQNAPDLPGLMFQLVAQPDGSVSFPTLSDGCLALLGLAPDVLRSQPEKFTQLILPQDLPSYLDSMQASATKLAAWNWEGRIWVDAWKDVKWINLRATPRKLGDAVQWDGLMTNITASRNEQLQVNASRERLAELTAHIEMVKEQERTRIAREIHDDLGGNLTAIKMALAMLANKLPPELKERADYVDLLVDRSIDAIHQISLDLRPPMLELGLSAALEWQCREFEKQNGIPCQFDACGSEPSLDQDRAVALFRIIQEALTNIAKHAKASQVVVSLASRQHQLSLNVCDNGVGIAPADCRKPGSFGLRGMAERAHALGARLSLSDAPGGGTIVTIDTAVQ
jgi:signal transduction histidine kinase